MEAPAKFGTADSHSASLDAGYELPKTSTGKIQKFKLREMAKGV